MTVDPETVRRLVAEILGHSTDPGRAEDAARRLGSILDWVRGLDEDRLRGSEPAGVFDPADPAWDAPPGPVPAWPTVRRPQGGTGYGAPPAGAARVPAEDRPPRGVPLSGGLESLPLAEVARLIRERRASPAEVVERALARVEELDGELEAFITVTAGAAREAARRAERRLTAAEAPGPLHGIPVAVKDIIDTAGVRTTCGSRILGDRVPGTDAAAVARLVGAGAVVVGKTNTHEFAFGATTVNPHYGTCRNPWNPGCVAGGSSGGSAVAVATGMCYLALGTDTGGSIRIPAACCGVVGLKPTYGLVSKEGVFPLSWSLDHVGPLARTVADAALALTVLTGGSGEYLEEVARAADGLRGLAVGVNARWLEDRVQPEVAAAVRRGIGALEGAGARVREVGYPPSEPLVLANRLILLAEAAALHRPWLADRADQYGPDVRARLELGELLPAVDYLAGQRLRRELCRAAAQTMREVDLLVTPTLPVVAPHVGQDYLEWPDGRETVPDALIRLTSAFNVTGQPALSIPCGTGQGRPVGLQLVGRWFGEGIVLRAAAVLESALRVPPGRP